jgi:hypothetical protein
VPLARIDVVVEAAIAGGQIEHRGVAGKETALEMSDDFTPDSISPIGLAIPFGVVSLVVRGRRR